MPPRRGGGRGGGEAEGRRGQGGEAEGHRRRGRDGGGEAEGRRGRGGDGGGGEAEARRGGRGGGGQQGRGGDGGGRGNAGGNAQADVPGDLTSFPYGDIDPTMVYYLRVPSIDDPENLAENWSKIYELLIVTFRLVMGPIDFCEVEGGKIVMMSNNSPNVLYNLVIYYDNDNWIILFYRITDMYLVGFRNRHDSFRFRDANYDGMSPLLFHCNYGSIEEHASSKISSIQLGTERLRVAVQHLSRLTVSNSERRDPNIAAGLLVSVLMFAESSRFEPIFEHIKNNLDNMGYFSLLDYHKYYIKNWSKFSKVLIAAKERPDMIKRINDAIARGLHGLGDEEESRGFPLDDGLHATNVEDVKSLIRVVSNQSLEDSVALFGPQG